MKRCIFSLCNRYDAWDFTGLSWCRTEYSLLCPYSRWFAVVQGRIYAWLSLLFDDTWLPILRDFLIFTLSSCLLIFRHFLSFAILVVSFLFAVVLRSLSGHLAILDIVLDFRGYIWCWFLGSISGLCFCLLLPYDLSLRFTVLSLWLRGFLLGHRADWCIHRFWLYPWFLFTLILIIVIGFWAFLNLLALLARREARLDERLDNLDDTFDKIGPLVFRAELCPSLRDQVDKDIEDLLVPEGGHDHGPRSGIITFFDGLLFLFLL